MCGITREAVHALFLVNIGLQLCDGLATYYGVQRGMPEANPLLHASITQWGVGGALVGWKGLAGGLLLFLRLVPSRVLAVKALTLTVTVYLCFSLLPWLAVFLPRWVG